MMRPFSLSNKADWLQMPEQIGREDLGPIATRIERFQAPVTLDFSTTRHIDFRAWHDFVTRLRDLDRGPTALRLYGLSSYCEQIVRFVSAARDGDLFEQLFGTNGFSGEGEISNEFATTNELGSGWMPWDEHAYPWSPSQN